jgi:hypothetical protein
MTDEQINLPPLPKLPRHFHVVGEGRANVTLFSGGQVRDYARDFARAAVLADRAARDDGMTEREQFEAWWNLEPHRAKYSQDHPVFLGAFQAWHARAARAALEQK